MTQNISHPSPELPLILQIIKENLELNEGLEDILIADLAQLSKYNNRDVDIDYLGAQVLVGKALESAGSEADINQLINNFLTNRNDIYAQFPEEELSNIQHVVFEIKAGIISKQVKPEIEKIIKNTPFKKIFIQTEDVEMIPSEIVVIKEVPADNQWLELGASTVILIAGAFLWVVNKKISEIKEMIAKEKEEENNLNMEQKKEEIEEPILGETGDEEEAINIEAEIPGDSKKSLEEQGSIGFENNEENQLNNMDMEVLLGKGETDDEIFNAGLWEEDSQTERAKEKILEGIRAHKENGWRGVAKSYNQENIDNDKTYTYQKGTEVILFKKDKLGQIDYSSKIHGQYFGQTKDYYFVALIDNNGEFSEETDIISQNDFDIKSLEYLKEHASKTKK